MESIIIISIAAICVSLAVIACLVFISLALRKYLIIKHDEIEIKRAANKIAAKNDHSSLEYSEKLLEFIKNIIAQVTVLKFKIFIENRDLTMITQAQLKKLTTDIASLVYESLVLPNLDLNGVIYTEKFLNTYIVDTALKMSKDLLDKAIHDADVI